MVAEAEFCYANVDKNKILQIHNNKNAVIIIAIENNTIVGFISGFAHEYFFSNRLRVSDLGFYVKPEYRGSRVSLKLLKELENWAKNLGIEDLHLGQTTAINMDKTKQFYERLGYKTVGFNTVKHLKE